MKKLLVSVLFTLGLAGMPATPAQGQSNVVVFSYGDFLQSKQTMRKLYLFQLWSDSGNPAGITTTDRRTFWTDPVNGLALVTNMLPGFYRGEFQGVWVPTTNWFTIPTNSGTIYASNCVESAYARARSTIPAYSMPQSDARYLQQGVLQPGSNTTFRASGTNVFIDTQAGGSGSSGPAGVVALAPLAATTNSSGVVAIGVSDAVVTNGGGFLVGYDHLFGPLIVTSNPASGWLSGYYAGGFFANDASGGQGTFGWSGAGYWISGAPIWAPSFTGSGSGITGINPSALTGPGTLPAAAFPINLPIAGTVTAGAFSGNGQNLTALNGSQVLPGSLNQSSFDALTTAWIAGMGNTNGGGGGAGSNAVPIFAGSATNLALENPVLRYPSAPGNIASTNWVILFFQPASTNLTLWALYSTNAFASSNALQSATNLVSQFANAHFQPSSLNLSNWSLTSVASFTTNTPQLQQWSQIYTNAFSGMSTAAASNYMAGAAFVMLNNLGSGYLPQWAYVPTNLVSGSITNGQAAANLVSLTVSTLNMAPSGIVSDFLGVNGTFYHSNAAPNSVFRSLDTNMNSVTHFTNGDVVVSNAQVFTPTIRVTTLTDLRGYQWGRFPEVVCYLDGTYLANGTIYANPTSDTLGINEAIRWLMWSNTPAGVRSRGGTLTLENGYHRINGTVSLDMWTNMFELRLKGCGQTSCGILRTNSVAGEVFHAGNPTFQMAGMNAYMGNTFVLSLEDMFFGSTVTGLTNVVCLDGRWAQTPGNSILYCDINRCQFFYGPSADPWTEPPAGNVYSLIGLHILGNGCIFNVRHCVFNCLNTGLSYCSDWGEVVQNQCFKCGPYGAGISAGGWPSTEPYYWGGGIIVRDEAGGVANQNQHVTMMGNQYVNCWPPFWSAFTQSAPGDYNTIDIYNDGIEPAGGGAVWPVCGTTGGRIIYHTSRNYTDSTKFKTMYAPAGNFHDALNTNAPAGIVDFIDEVYHTNTMAMNYGGILSAPSFKFTGSGITGTTNSAPTNTATIRAWRNYTNIDGTLFKEPLYQ